MTQEKDPKVAAKVCFDSIGLDPELYRIGHTKASATPSRVVVFEPDFRMFFKKLQYYVVLSLLLPPDIDDVLTFYVDPSTLRPSIALGTCHIHTIQLPTL